jgi:hypothetical protein
MAPDTEALLEFWDLFVKTSTEDIAKYDIEFGEDPEPITPGLTFSVILANLIQVAEMRGVSRTFLTASLKRFSENVEHLPPHAVINKQALN